MRLDALAGLRWLQLREDLTLGVQTLGVPGASSGVAGQFFNTQDAFALRNDFVGGQVGGRAEYCTGGLSIQATAKFALGTMHETADIRGLAQTSSGNLFFSTDGLGRQPFPGGVFAQSSNIGRHNRDRFAVVPEATLVVAYQPTAWLRLCAGYNFLYLSDVARPGDQIDRAINTTRTGLADVARAAGTGPAITGPALPAFGFHDSSFWAQGVSVGLEFRY
jgi:hypothetical protein